MLKLLKFPEPNRMQDAISYLVDQMRVSEDDEYLIQALMMKIIHNRYFELESSHLTDAICIKLIEIQALIDECHQRTLHVTSGNDTDDEEF